MNHRKSKAHKSITQSYEEYVPPITMSLPEWKYYVSSGKNTLYGDAIIPSGTTDDGAVYSGHVRQNPWTAGMPDEE